MVPRRRPISAVEQKGLKEPVKSVVAAESIDPGGPNLPSCLTSKPIRQRQWQSPVRSGSSDGGADQLPDGEGDGHGQCAAGHQP